MKIWKIIAMGIVTLGVATLFYCTLTFGHFNGGEPQTKDFTVVLLACAGIWVTAYIVINRPPKIR